MRKNSISDATKTGLSFVNCIFEDFQYKHHDSLPAAYLEIYWSLTYTAIKVDNVTE